MGLDPKLVEATARAMAAVALREPVMSLGEDPTLDLMSIEVERIWPDFIEMAKVGIDTVLKRLERA